MWDRDSTAAVDRVRYRLSDAQHSLSLAKRNLDRAHNDLERSDASRFLAPVLFLVTSLAASVLLIKEIPTALMDTGGNWAAGWLVMDVLVLLIAVACIADNRQERADAPAQVQRCEAELGAADRRIVDFESQVADVTAEADEKAAQAKRFAALQDQLLEIGSYVASAHEAVSGAADEGLAWEELAAERGWPEHFTNLIRGADEAKRIAQIGA